MLLVLILGFYVKWILENSILVFYNKFYTKKEFDI